MGKATVFVGDRFESNNYGWFAVVAVYPRSVYDIRFEATGADRLGVSLSAIRAGTVRDYSAPNTRSAEHLYPVGSRWKSNNHGWLKIVAVDGVKRITVQFENTGNVAVFQGGSVSRGTIADEVSIANMPKDFYVYGAFVEDICVYVGKGKGHRYKHCNSGTSSNFGLNKMFFEGVQIDVKILHSGMCNTIAGELEKAYLKHYSPVCNIQLMPGAIDAFGRFRADPAKVAYYENKQSK